MATVRQVGHFAVAARAAAAGEPLAGAAAGAAHDAAGLGSEPHGYDEWGGEGW